MSVNLKEWYLVETYSRLVTAIGPDKAAQALIELREHLDESEADYSERGLNGSLATQAAMDRLGSPKKIALGFVKGGSPRAGIYWTFGLLIFALLTHFIERANPGDPPTSLYWIGMLGLPIAGALVTRRAMNFGILACGFLVLCGARIWHLSGYVYVPGSDSMQYAKAHTIYQGLVADHHEFSKLESGLVAQWRKALGSPANGKVVYSRLTYNDKISQNVVPIYLGNEVIGLRYENATSERFQYSPRIGSEMLSEPLAVARKHIAGRINEVHSRQKSRVAKLVGFRAGLNTSRMTRLNQVAPWTIFGTGGMAGIAWLTSAGVASMVVSFRTRRKQLLA